LIAYRRRENWGTLRKIDAQSIMEMDRKMDNLTVIAGSSDDPPVTLKPLIIIIDLILHTKLIISKFKRSVRDLNPRGWCRGPAPTSRVQIPSPPKALNSYVFLSSFWERVWLIRPPH